MSFKEWRNKNFIGLLEVKIMISIEHLRQYKLKRSSGLNIKIADNEREQMQAFMVRAIVYMHEQNCPFEEEFDLNDFTATQVIGFLNREPVLTARIRYFGEFAKLERLAVRKEYRSFGYGQELLSFMIDFCRKKGYKKVYLHAQEGRENFYYRNGFKRKGETFSFSGYSYSEMCLDLCDLPKEAEGLSLKSEQFILNRPEGIWHRPGPLEKQDLMCNVA